MKALALFLGVAVLVLLLILLTGCAGPRSDAQRIAAVERGLLPEGAFPPWTAESLASRMRHYRVPGLGIAVIDGWRVTWVRGYGVTETGLGKPVTVDTLFPALGNSAIVSNYLAMILVEKGLLDPDRDVNQVLRTWKVPDNTFTSRRKVTPKMLIEFNSSGLNEFRSEGYAAGTPYPSLVQVLSGEPPAVNPPVRVVAEPGTPHGGGQCFLVETLVLEQLMADLEGRPFPEIAADRLFIPLGLYAATFEQPLPADFRERAVTGHVGGVPLPGKRRVYPDRAAMGLWATPADLARLVAEMCRSYRGLSSRFVSRATAARFLAVDHPNYRHYSSATGGESAILYNPATGQGVVLMMNGGPDAGGLRDEILQCLFRQYRWTWGYDLIWNPTFKQGWMLVLALVLAGLIAALTTALHLQGRRTAPRPARDTHSSRSRDTRVIREDSQQMKPQMKDTHSIRSQETLPPQGEDTHRPRTGDIQRPGAAAWPDKEES
ncbi:MAG: beta-lactamase family protein [Acidobacteria bacterium]|nr:beta-lactamase family protein [Acidobacteriota bacterium]